MKSIFDYINFLNKNILNYDKILLDNDNIEYSQFKLLKTHNNIKNQYYSNIYYIINSYSNNNNNIPINLDVKRENLKFTTPFLKCESIDNNNNSSNYVYFDLNNDIGIIIKKFIKELEQKIINDFYQTLILDLDLVESTNNLSLDNNNVPSEIINNNSETTSKSNINSFKFYSNINEQNNTLKCKIGSIEDLFLYDYNYNLIDNYNIIDDNIKKQIHVQPNLSCMGIWVYGNKFGLTWVCSQLRFDKKSIYVPNFLNNSDSNDSSDSK